MNRINIWLPSFTWIREHQGYKIQDPPGGEKGGENKTIYLDNQNKPTSTEASLDELDMESLRLTRGIYGNLRSRQIHIRGNKD